MKKRRQSLMTGILRSPVAGREDDNDVLNTPLITVKQSKKEVRRLNACAETSHCVFSQNSVGCSLKVKHHGLHITKQERGFPGGKCSKLFARSDPKYRRQYEVLPGAREETALHHPPPRNLAAPRSAGLHPNSPGFFVEELHDKDDVLM